MLEDEPGESNASNGADEAQPLTYGSYLRVPELLDLQSEFADEQEVEAYAKTMAELLTQAMRLQSSRPDDIKLRSCNIRPRLAGSGLA